MENDHASTNCLVLLGHNGAGKSTLIRWLLNFYTDTNQHPFLPGFASIAKLDRRGLGFVPELPMLDQHLRTHELFRLFASFKHTSLTETEMSHLLSRTGLSHDLLKLPIKQFSKGMKQRLMIALALIGKPHTLLLDEPLSGLDPFGHQQIIGLLKEVKKTTRLILSTHNLHDAWALADTVWLLQAGRFVYQGQKPDTEEALNALYFDHPPHHHAA